MTRRQVDAGELCPLRSCVFCRTFGYVLAVNREARVFPRRLVRGMFRERALHRTWRIGDRVAAGALMDGSSKVWRKRGKPALCDRGPRPTAWRWC